MGFIESSQQAAVSPTRDVGDRFKLVSRMGVEVGVTSFVRYLAQNLVLCVERRRRGLDQVLSFFGIRRGLRLAGFIDAQTIRDSQFSKHSVDVILNGLF
jgi:hypothetical protein